MTVGEICTRTTMVVQKIESVVDAAKRMRASHVGDLVVVENHAGRQYPVGFIPDRDIVGGAVAGDLDHINYLLVDDVMSDDLVTAREDQSIEVALKRMAQHGVRRLPIIDADGALVGILALDDVLEYLTEQRELVSLVARQQRRERQYRI